MNENHERKDRNPHMTTKVMTPAIHALLRSQHHLPSYESRERTNLATDFGTHYADNNFEDRSASRTEETASEINASPNDNLALKYPSQALAQNRAQFWATLIAASLTFSFGISLISLAAYGYIALGHSLQVAAIEALLSIICEAVAVLFFRQLNETRKHTVEMYDRLRFDERIAVAIGLTESIEDLSIRSATKAKLVPLLVKPQHFSVNRTKGRV